MALAEEDKTKEGENIGDAHMRRITGISKRQESAMDRRARENLQEASGTMSPEAMRNSDSGQEDEDGGNNEKALDSDSLKNAEAGAGDTSSEGDSESTEQDKLTEHENQIGPGLVKEKPGRMSKALATISGMSGRKKALAGGGIVGVLIMSVALLFLSLLPLKINHIVENLTNHFYASSEAAVGTRTEILFSNYLKKYILPGMTVDGPCKSTRTISKSCVKIVEGDSPAKRLYKGWSDARLENTLSTKYGIEIQKGRFDSTDGQNHYKLLVNGTNTSIDIDGFVNEKGSGANVFAATGGRNDVRQKFKEAFSQETLWKRVMYRFKVGRLLERKYGVERCLFFCKLKDNFNDWKDEKTGKRKDKIARSLLALRVLGTRSEATGLILACMVSDKCNDFVGSGKDHQRQDKFEQDLSKVLKDLDGKLLKYTANDILKELEKYEESGGLGKYLLQKVINKFITNEAVSKGIGNLVPILGQINTVAGWVNNIYGASSHLKRWIYVANATAMVSVFVMYRSHADELRNGKVDPQLLGEMTKALGDHAGDGTHQGQPAESTPLYTELMGSKPAQNTSILNIFSPTAYAQATAAKPTYKYTCGDDKPVPTGKVVCPEENLKTGGVIAFFQDVLNSPPFSSIHEAAQIWHDTLGQIFDIISRAGSFAADIIMGLPPIQKIMDLIGGTASDIMNPFIKKAADELFPSPISDNPSGGSTFDNMAGGADVSGNDYAHYGTGGGKISDATAAAIRTQQENDARQQFTAQPFFARMFNKDSPYSFISRVAMAMPMNFTDFSQSSFANLISEPFTKLARAFSSLFTTRFSYAATAAPDPFGVPQFGYSSNDPALTMDSDVLTDAYCKKMNDDWVNNDIHITDYSTGAYTLSPLGEDPDTGTDVHITTNPCLLETAATGSAGAVFTDTVLTADDNTDPGGGGGSSTSTTTGTASSCSLSRQKMVDQILGHEADGLIQFDNPGSEKGDINDASKTTDQLICVIWSLLEQGHFHIIISAINSDHAAGGDHGAGKAVDLGRSDANKPDQPQIFTWLYQNAKTLQIHQLIHQPVPAGAHMINTDIGGDGICDEPATDSFPNCSYGASTLNDHASHIHVGVL